MVEESDVFKIKDDDECKILYEFIIFIILLEFLNFRIFNILFWGKLKSVWISQKCLGKSLSDFSEVGTYKWWRLLQFVNPWISTHF